MSGFLSTAGSHSGTAVRGISRSPSLRFPGIKERNSKAGEVLHIAGGNGQIVRESCSCYQAVDDGKWCSEALRVNGQCRPLVCNRLGDRKQAVVEGCLNVGLPHFQLCAPFAVGSNSMPRRISAKVSTLANRISSGAAFSQRSTLESGG